jgi:two-component system chemotaxis response regulator CheY
MSNVSLQDLTILMVAPSRVLAAVLRKELGDMGAVQTVSCKNISEAMDKMREVQPDLVVSSMYFEDGDGIDLITTMRHEEAFKDTLFMLISSETRFEMLDPVRQAGVVAVLSRPFTQEALIQAVNTTLGYLDEKAASIDHQKLTSLKLLLVDDSKLARRHMLNVLEKLGITPVQIIQAEHGFEAVEKLKEEKFDLVLTDYNMPQMDGEELLKYIRQHSELDNMPVIMVTSEENETKLASIKSHGVTAMLNKPFDPPNLKALLENHL